MPAFRISLRSRSRVLPLFVALSLAVPAGLAVAPGRAAAACYIVYSSDITTTSASVSPGPGRTYWSTVTYQVGYNTCSMSYPAKLKVVSFRNTLKISGLGPYYHVDWAASVLDWWTDFGPYGTGYTAWWDNGHITHYGDNTYTRARSPNVVLPYDTRAAVTDMWTGCGYYGTGTCQFAFRFRTGQIYKFWSLS